MKRLLLMVLVGCGGSEAATSSAPIAGASDWSSLHAGLEQNGSKIPRSGLANGTLQRALGISVEPYGAIEELAGRSFVAGKVSHFGGPSDTGVSPTETGAITGERLRSLDGYYVAMRFDYAPNGRTSWRDVRLLVVNPSDQSAVVVRPVDWGPHTRTGRIIDLSPQAVEDLGVDTDDRVYVAFAPPDAPLGVVVAPAIPSTAITIDNSDPLRFRASSRWQTSDFAAGRIGADYRFRGAELTSDPAEYRVPIEHAGSYELFARVPGHGYNTNVPYLIRTTGGTTVVRRDISGTGPAWLSLGTHSLAAGDDWIVQISCWTTGTGYLIADAIRVEER